MLTLDRLRHEMAVSARLEEETYKALTLGLYRQLEAPLRDLYDELFAATRGFTAITAEVIRARPRTVKILRHAVVPVISQMRMGQLAGMRSTEPFEEAGLPPTTGQAEQMAGWFREYLDRDRFTWVGGAGPMPSAGEQRVAEHYAKLWTVSLVANQNALTDYRNVRKANQERAIADSLRAAGLAEQLGLGPRPSPTLPGIPRARGSRSPRTHRAGGIQSTDDVWPGHFVAEKKVLYGRRQKADLTARPSSRPQLVCIEAKAVGIRIDSTKRLKELNDKCTDWQACPLPIVTAGVCAGFFNEAELVATIRGRGIPVFWEHDLDRLQEFVVRGTYYGAPWDPASLFSEVPTERVLEGLEEIQTARSTSTEAGDEPVGVGPAEPE